MITPEKSPAASAFGNPPARNDKFVPAHEIRSAFSAAMSQMYRDEVPLYGDLLQIVDQINAKVLDANPVLETDLRRRGELQRLGPERHGAIRLGTAEELSMMRRVCAVMDMHPVGYYDLSVAGVPVHSTAFRPIELDSLNRNPFRIFTSLLRCELIEDEALREDVKRLLAQRQIFSDSAIVLVERFEREGGLELAAATAFVGAILETFRWHSDALVDARTYTKLHDVHRLVADVVSFKGPHINHLTPRTLDIDAAQEEMQARGMGAKAVIEGPPRRSVPILLRQTSFKALEEKIRFCGGEGEEQGTHTARFGEIEQRGLALTRKGRALYDSLLDEARGESGSLAEDYGQRLQQAFTRFPDDLDELRRQRLGYFRYHIHNIAEARDVDGCDLDVLVDQGIVKATPIVYEDFLPVSAAGIFQSNLGGGEVASYSASAAQAAFEQALGAPVADPFALYEAVERDSIASVCAALRRQTNANEVR